MEINTRAYLDQVLDEIKRKLIKLGKMADEALAKSLWSLKTKDVNTAKIVISDDDNLDKLRYEIENDCLKFIARFQPLGEDLRAVSSYMYIAGDLERFGDYGASIAKVTVKLAGQEYIKPLIDLPRMQEIVSDMLDKAMEALDLKDLKIAKDVFSMDDDVDDLEQQIFRELTLMMMEDTRRIEQASSLFFVARNLERAGDHITNVAERVFYISTGEITSASKFRRPLTFGE